MQIFVINDYLKVSTLFFILYYDFNYTSTKFINMIKRQGDYWVCEEPISPASQDIREQSQPPQQMFYLEGSVKDRLALIRDEIEQLKQEKHARLKYQQKENDLFKKLKKNKEDSKPAIEIQLNTPAYLFKLNSRVEDLEAKVGRTQLYSQTVFKKGTLVDRIKVLQTKLTKLGQMSNEVVVKNINNYTTFIEQREDQFKHLFVYQQYMKSQGLIQQYKSIKSYLESLKILHEEGTSVPSKIIKLNNLHNQILQKGETSQAKYLQLHTFLREEFKLLQAQIRELQQCNC